MGFIEIYLMHKSYLIYLATFVEFYADDKFILLFGYDWMEIKSIPSVYT